MDENRCSLLDGRKTIDEKRESKDEKRKTIDDACSIFKKGIDTLHKKPFL
jgi:hypothetical protein